MTSPKSNRGHVLITGASTGIGRACAIYLASLGYDVFAGVREESSAPVAASIIPLLLDVTDPESIARAAERIRSTVESDGLKGLVNNAGICVAGPVEIVAMEDWRRQFDVNFFGQIAMTQAMLPLIRDHVAARGPWSGRIINIASIAGRIGQPMLGPYCASKFALEAISDSLRVELNAQQIHVSVVEPGAIQSEIWRKGQDGAKDIKAGPIERQRYGVLIDGITARAAEAAEQAIPAEHVARVVDHCLSSRRPKVRILVGKDARMVAMVKSLLPARWLDALMLRILSKPSPVQRPATTS